MMRKTPISSNTATSAHLPKASKGLDNGAPTSSVSSTKQSRKSSLDNMSNKHRQCSDRLLLTATLISPKAVVRATHAASKLTGTVRRKARAQEVNPRSVELPEQDNPGLPPDKETSKFLRNALKKHWMFDSKDTKDDRLALVKEFRPYTCPAGGFLFKRGGQPGKDDSLYVTQTGVIEFRVPNRPPLKVVTDDNPGQVFGELELLYDCPRGATVQCVTDVTVYRVSRPICARILASQRQAARQQKQDLIAQVGQLLPDAAETWGRLLTPRWFQADETIPAGKELWILHRGEVRNETKQEQLTAHSPVGLQEFLVGTDGNPQHHHGSMQGLPCIYKTTQPGLAFVLQRERLEKVMGGTKGVKFWLTRSQDVLRLGAVQYLSGLTPDQRQQLVRLIKHKAFAKDEVLFQPRKPTKPALYILRQGQIRVDTAACADGKVVTSFLGPGDCFGEELLSHPDAENNSKVTASSTVTASQTTVCAVLTLRQIRTLFDTVYDETPPESTAPVVESASKESPKSSKKKKDKTKTGKKNKTDATVIAAEKKEEQPEPQVSHPPVTGKDRKGRNARTGRPSSFLRPISRDNIVKDCETLVEKIPMPAKVSGFKKHRVLGEGTFGQVWLVTNPEDVTNRVLALKIQSKEELIEEGKADSAMAEKKVMEQLSHPFLIRMHQTYQDDSCLYCVLDFMQGGELFSLMHPNGECHQALSEDKCMFYTFGVADALAYMHTHLFAHRDLKPENVMIDSRGFPVLIDMGFAKKMTDDKAYTVCGTPGYIAPEIVMQKGHDYGVDHWSLGVMLAEMLTGENPFYDDEMDQMTYFHCVVNDPYEPPKALNKHAIDLINGLLTKDPAIRLGSLASGDADILNHPWFDELSLHLMRRKKILAPWIPRSKNSMDAGCFDEWGQVEDKSETVASLKAKNDPRFKDY